jgi:hypothetical protein
VNNIPYFENVLDAIEDDPSTTWDVAVDRLRAAKERYRRKQARGDRKGGPGLHPQASHGGQRRPRHERVNNAWMKAKQSYDPTMPCRFHFTPEGCPFKENCRFSHDQSAKARLFCNKCGSRGQHHTLNCPKPIPTLPRAVPANSADVVTCSYCNKKGHVKGNKCRQLRRDKKKSKASRIENVGLAACLDNPPSDHISDWSDSELPEQVLALNTSIVIPPLPPILPDSCIAKARALHCTQNTNAPHNTVFEQNEVLTSFFCCKDDFSPFNWALSMISSMKWLFAHAFMLLFLCIVAVPCALFLLVRWLRDNKIRVLFTAFLLLCVAPGLVSGERLDQRSPPKWPLTPELTAQACMVKINDTREDSSKGRWIIDSGCTAHLHGTDKDFCSGTVSKQLCTLVGFKGKNAGTAQYKCGKVVLNNAPNAPTSLDDVIHVPNLPRSLLSEGKLDKQGYVTVTYDGVKRIYNPTTGVLHLTATLTDGLYVVDDVCRKDVNQKLVNINNAETYTGGLSRAQIWHQRLGHASYETIKRMFNIHDISECFCPSCALAKSTRRPLKGSMSKGTHILEMIHSDICGPLQTETRGRKRYFVLFIDHYSRFTYCCLLRRKNETFSKFKELATMLKNQHGKWPEILHHDGGGEYLCKKMVDFCKENGIKQTCTAPNNPNQNPVAERKNRTVLESALAMLHHAGLPLTYWGEAVQYAVYVQNRIATPSLNNRSPINIWTNGKISDEKALKYCRAFGCEAYAHVYTKRKGSLKAVPCIFLGIDLVKKGYRLMTVRSKTIFVCRDVTFNETSFPGANTQAGSERKRAVPAWNLDEVMVTLEKGSLSARKSPPINTSIESKTNTSTSSSSNGYSSYRGNGDSFFSANTPDALSPISTPIGNTSTRTINSTDKLSSPYTADASPISLADSPVIPGAIGSCIGRGSNRTIYYGSTNRRAGIHGSSPPLSSPSPNSTLSISRSSATTEVLSESKIDLDVEDERKYDKQPESDSVSQFSDDEGDRKNHSPSSLLLDSSTEDKLIDEMENTRGSLTGSDEENEDDQKEVNSIRRSTRTREPSGSCIRNAQVNLVNSCSVFVHVHHSIKEVFDEPKTRRQMLASIFSKEWTAAEIEEIDALIENGTWELVALPPGKKPLSCRWVYKLKLNEKGEMEKRKARLVVRGFEQLKDIDYTETYASTAKFNSFRALCAIAALNKLDIIHMDVSNAFLNGKCEEEIYMKQPPGYDDMSGMVCRLIKCLYGLKQAPRAWNKTLTAALQAHGFTRTVTDESVYVKRQGNDYCLIACHVDDLAIACNNKKMLADIRATLSKKFKMKDFGSMSHYLGVHVNTTQPGIIKLDQHQYINKMLDSFSMQNCNSFSTPMEEGLKLMPADQPDDDADKTAMASIPYAGIVGSLMYGMIATRPDIAFAVGMLARFMCNPGMKHWKAAKRALAYLSKAPEQGLRYTADGNSELVAYCDADWGTTDYYQRRSVSGYVIMLAGAPISWASRRQKLTALSSTEAEYIALSECLREVLYLRKLMTELGFPPSGPTKIYCDNEAAIAIANNPVHHQRSKHIDIRYHRIRNHISNGDVEVLPVDTADNLADAFTKPLGRVKYTKFTDIMMA